MKIGDEYVTCRVRAHPFSIKDEAGAITEPETGLTFGYLRYCEVQSNRMFVTVECLYADKLAADLEKTGREKIPDYAFDCHTQKGRKMGKTKAEFFRDKQAALEPFQPGLFDDLIGG